MRKLLYLPSIFFLVAGCETTLEELSTVDQIRYGAEFAIPLVDSRVNLTDLVGELDQRVTLSTEADGLLRLTYRDTVPTVSSQAAFEELSQLTRGIPLAITARRQAIRFPLPNGAQLKRVRVKSGRLTYNLPNPYDRPVNIKLTIPSATKEGTAFTISGKLPAHGGSGNPPALNNIAEPIDFAGYEFDFSTDSLILEYRIDGLDGTPLEPGNNTLAVFSNLEFSFIEGFLGKRPYAGVSDQLSIGLFDNYLSGEVKFLEPRIVLTVHNGFGMPARAVIDRLDVTTVTGEIIAVTGEIIQNGFDLNYPSQPGRSSTTTYVITEENSNLRELLAAKPVALNYHINALLNPDPADKEVVGFLTDTSTYGATIAVELPLYGSAREFTLKDSFPIDIGDRYPEVTEASFRITTDNGIPFALSLTGTFIDSKGNVLMDLTDGELLLIEASAVNTAGDATEVRTVTTDIPFSGERLELLRRADHLLLVTTFGTTENASGPIRITDDQELRVRIGARLTANQE